jgi:hypothetical protein
VDFTQSPAAQLRGSMPGARWLPTWLNLTESSLQVLHKWNVWLRNVGEEKKVIVGEMVEDKAVELASTMVTETLIYSVCNSHQVLFPSRFMNVL